MLVPMKLFATTLEFVPASLMYTPHWLLPEITLRPPASVVPMTSRWPDCSTTTPSRALGIAAMPE